MDETKPLKTVRCRNPKNGVVYVYSYELFYDPAQKKYRQRRRCIGKVSETGEVVPTSAHGSRKAKKAPDSESTVQTEKGTLKSSKEESYLLQIQELKEQVRTMDMELAKVRRELIRAQESKERLKKAIGSVLDNY